MTSRSAWCWLIATVAIGCAGIIDAIARSTKNRETTKYASAGLVKKQGELMRAETSDYSTDLNSDRLFGQPVNPGSLAIAQARSVHQNIGSFDAYFSVARIERRSGRLTTNNYSPVRRGSPEGVPVLSVGTPFFQPAGAVGNVDIVSNAPNVTRSWKNHSKWIGGF